MSPEQLAGRSVDGRADLYSLGVLMFQMLTSRLPIIGPSMAGLIHAVAHTPAPSVQKLRPGVPEELANVVSILLEKRPELRYRDGLALAEDLRLIAAMLRPRAPRSPAHPAVTPDAPDQALADDASDETSVQDVARAGDSTVPAHSAMRAQSGT
jgi:serine/threonine-protein kinase